MLKQERTDERGGEGGGGYGEEEEAKNKQANEVIKSRKSNDGLTTDPLNISLPDWPGQTQLLVNAVWKKEYLAPNPALNVFLLFLSENI